MRTTVKSSEQLLDTGNVEASVENTDSLTPATTAPVLQVRIPTPAPAAVVADQVSAYVKLSDVAAFLQCRA